jgi:hypothetical protein
VRSRSVTPLHTSPAPEEEGGAARRARDARKGAATAFDQVASPLQSADFGTDSASTGERQILITDLIDSINIYPDQVTVQVVGAPAIQMTLVGGKTVVSETRRNRSDRREVDHRDVR